MIRLSGYTYEEKLQIAIRPLVPKQLAENGLVDKLEIPEEVLQHVIDRYTSEAGVRNLERKIGALCRSHVVKLAKAGATMDSEVDCIVMTIDEASRILGVHHLLTGQPEPHRDELKRRLDSPGVAVGLAWTPHGGEIMFIEVFCPVDVEVSSMPGSGLLKLTGQLGDVMKVSSCFTAGKRNFGAILGEERFASPSGKTFKPKQGGV